MKDNEGRTPLSWVAECGNEGVVKLLLETGKADVDSTDEQDRTPLRWARDISQFNSVLDSELENDDQKKVVELALLFPDMEGSNGRHCTNCTVHGRVVLAL